MATEADPPVNTKKASAEDSPLSAARKTFITTLVAICLNPVSAAVGYYMNHILQRPELTIAYASETYTVANHAMDPAVLKSIRSYPALGARLRSSLMQTKQGGDPDCLDWLDGKDWHDECVGRVQSVVDGISNADAAELEAIQVNIKALEEWSPPGPLSLLPTQAAQPEILVLQAQKDKNGALNMLRGPIVMLERQAEVLKRLGAALVPMQKDDTPRTGEMTLTIGLLNKGDSDGVVSNRATLKFKGSELWMIVADSWTTVKAHSFQELVVKAGGDDDAGKSMKAWHEAITANKPFDVELTLNSNADMPRATYKATISKQ